MSLTFAPEKTAPLNVSPLEHAILATLTYSDIFDYPLTLDELHRYLVTSAIRDEIGECLINMKEIACKEGYYYLADRPEIVDIRKQRESNSHNAFDRAMSYGHIMAKLPFVRMVAMTGSLAMLNLSTHRDMDYLLVTAPGRLWTARAFVLLFGRLARIFGDVICPNVIVSENALEWNAKNLYTAREFAQMIPVHGAEILNRLRIVNLWILDILPNANAVSGSYVPRSGMLPNGNKDPSIFQKLIEYVLTNKLGDFLESWEMNRKIARFKKQAGYGEETNFTADICQGNFDHHAAWTMRAYEKRLSALVAVPGDDLSGTPSPGTAMGANRGG